MPQFKNKIKNVKDPWHPFAHLMLKKKGKKKKHLKFCNLTKPHQPISYFSFFWEPQKSFSQSKQQIFPNQSTQENINIWIARNITGMLSIFHNSYIPINIKTQINTTNNQMDNWVRERERDRYYRVGESDGTAARAASFSEAIREGRRGRWVRTYYSIYSVSFLAPAHLLANG